MDVAGTNAVIGTFVFPTVEEQLSDAWMGGFVGKYLADSAKALEEGAKSKHLATTMRL